MKQKILACTLTIFIAVMLFTIGINILISVFAHIYTPQFIEETYQMSMMSLRLWATLIGAIFMIPIGGLMSFIAIVYT